MSMIDLEKFRTTPLIESPFEHAVVPNFIQPTAMQDILSDYPDIEQGGSFPISHLTFGPVFQKLCDELQGPAMRDAFSEKLGMDLSDRPTTLTVRGICRKKDGQIHTDSRSKLITVLIYMNGPWEDDGGRLRLLNNGDSLDDYFAEVPTTTGNAALLS